MCDLATAQIAMTAIGGSFSVMQGASQANDQAELSRYNAAVARNDAILAEQRAAIDARNIRREKERVLGRHRANLGKAGIQKAGSPLQVFLETAENFEEDALLREHSGNVEATAKRNQSQLDLFEADRRRSQGFAQAGGSLLGTASKLTGQFLDAP